MNDDLSRNKHLLPISLVNTATAFTPEKTKHEASRMFNYLCIALFKETFVCSLVIDTNLGF